MSDLKELINLVEEQEKDWKSFQAVQIKRIENLERHAQDAEKKAGRPLLGGGPDTSLNLSPEQEIHRKTFDSYLRKGETDNLAEIQQKAMNSGADPDGGYMVLPEMDMVIDRIAETESAMHRLADVRTIKTAKYEKLVKTSGMAMSRVADGGTAGETTEPQYAKIAIEVHTAEVEPWVFNETLDDAFVDLATDLADEAGTAFAEGGGSEFISGDGVGKARGFLSYDIVSNASYTWGNVGYIASGKAAAFTSVAPGDQLIDLQHSLRQKYRKGAVFLMNDATLGVVRQIKDQSGSYYLWQPDPAAAFGGRLLGHPVEIDDNMPDIGAGAYAIAFGNFKRGYKIINRSGTTMIRDPYTSKGKTKFNFRRRFGGGIFNFEAIKLMKFATG